MMIIVMVIMLQVDEALEFVDSYIQRLMDGLYRQHLHKFVHVTLDERVNFNLFFMSVLSRAGA